METVNPIMEERPRDSLGVDESAIRSRVAAAIEVGGGLAAMVKKTGIPRGTLEKYVARTSAPSFANAARIAFAAGVSLEQVAYSPTVALEYGAAKVASDPDSLVTIPRYDQVRPSAGHGAAVISEAPSTRIAFERRWLTELGIQISAALILPCQGDSMEPTIKNGAPMLIDASVREIRNGFIYVFDVSGDLMVKRIERLPDGTINLISDNAKYPPRNLAQHEVERMTIIGRVHAAVLRF